MSAAAALPGSVVVGGTPTEVAELAACWLVERSAAVVAEGRRFHVALAGGSTPQRMFDVLASPRYRGGVPWDRWEVWFGDERACPPDDPASNWRLARDHLLGLVSVAAEHVHRMEGERADLDAAAADYAAELARLAPPGLAGAPRLDALLLGLGTNGHTASLFPGDPALEVDTAWVARSRADYAPYDRLTFTFPTINAAAAVAFTVCGADKGQALRDVVAGTAPAARVRPVDGALTWFLDSAASTAAG